MALFCEYTVVPQVVYGQTKLGYMDKEIDIDRFTVRLQERRRVLLAAKENSSRESAPKELDQARVGRLSRMDAMQQQAMGQAAARLAAQELQRIDLALSRISSGEFGYCILCDEEIASKRLEFDPSLMTCIVCARKAES